ncbi:hypothetical protein H6G36_28840 [Anabaena minutissima FACHB-250]|nr:hypothetical protein [Anabaena minutissima FACHB-250]
MSIKYSQIWTSISYPKRVMNRHRGSKRSHNMDIPPQPHTSCISLYWVGTTFKRYIMIENNNNTPLWVNSHATGADNLIFTTQSIKFYPRFQPVL